MPRGGPDGGDGGRGGSVLVRATDSLTDLSQFTSRARWVAPNGGDGRGSRKTGRAGGNIVLEVPVGTEVRDADERVIADLAHPGAEAMIAKGGTGGRGNIHFKSSRRRAPDYSEPGRKGEEGWVTLDLKLIADVGLVGPPNAGKSSLLASLTAARPKVANYPFTTLDPELGVADSDAGRIVFADIPGLVEGASRGIGLGLRFLRHVERTRVLLFVVDGSSPSPWDDLRTIRSELAAFSPELSDRPHIVAVNKVDLEPARKLRARTRRKGVHFVSALSGEGLDELMDAVVVALAAAPVAVPRLIERVQSLTPAGEETPTEVLRTDWGWEVKGSRLERLLERTNLDSAGSMEHFQSRLDRDGVNAALEAAGVQPGDTVRIGEVEFEYQP